MLPIDRAESVYEALRRTPFASLYGSSNWHDDLAEYVTWYHLTQKLGQPYRIVIRDAGKETFAYEPMKSPIVRNRFDQMDTFYRTAGPDRIASRYRLPGIQASCTRISRWLRDAAHRRSLPRRPAR